MANHKKALFIPIATLVISLLLFVPIFIFVMMSTHIEDGTAEKKWLEGSTEGSIDDNYTTIIQEFYDTEITDRQRDWRTDSIKLSTNAGFDFWYKCHGPRFDVGAKCVFMNADGTEAYRFGELLFYANSDKIIQLANKYHGHFDEKDVYAGIDGISFDDSYDTFSFIDELKQIKSIRIASEICESSQWKGSNCWFWSPVDIRDETGKHDIFTY